LKKHKVVLIEALAPAPLSNNPNEAKIKFVLAETMIFPKTQILIEIKIDFFLPILSLQYENTKNPIKDPI